MASLKKQTFIYDKNLKKTVPIEECTMDTPSIKKLTRNATATTEGLYNYVDEHLGFIRDPAHKKELMKQQGFNYHPDHADCYESSDDNSANHPDYEKLVAQRERAERAEDAQFSQARTPDESEIRAAREWMLSKMNRQ